ncbi:hypothetical protein [Nocardioides bigeumensis]|uniref:Uncharacterized protein n=1 Tax=Nocardioides bigeumensis TaxID=433657 RepID=A0ABP5KH84_9ACTN
MTGRKISLAALAAAALVAVMLVVYVRIMDGQDDSPAWWVVAVLVVGGGAAAYGGVSSTRPARIALLVATILLGCVGLLAILSIGLPILVASGLCFIAFLRGIPSGVPADPAAHP